MCPRRLRRAGPTSRFTGMFDARARSGAGHLASPQPDALVRWDVVLVAGLHAERVVPRVHVARGSDDAPVRRAVGVGQDLPADAGLAALAPPDLREAQEVPLLAGVAVDDRRGFAVERVVIRLQRNLEPREIADILTHRQLAVHVQAGHAFVGVVLRAERPDAFFKRCAVLVGPPALELA